MQKRYPFEFENYYKFTTIRNPYDTIISNYYWIKNLKKDHHRQNIVNITKNNDINLCIRNNIFMEYLPDNWSIFTIQDKPVCDFYIKYENLKEDINSLVKTLNLPNSNIDELLNFKSGYKEKKSYKEMLDKKSINIIENKYKKELNFFKYKY